MNRENKYLIIYTVIGIAATECEKSLKTLHVTIMFLMFISIVIGVSLMSEESDMYDDDNPDEDTLEDEDE